MRLALCYTLCLVAFGLLTVATWGTVWTALCLALGAVSIAGVAASITRP